MKTDMLPSMLEVVRNTHPLVHNITNYVTVNDCANALLAIDASPIMSDEAEDVEDITSICGGLTLNIGTLNQATIEGMKRAAAKSSSLAHPIVLDPVGAGASTLRTQTAEGLLENYKISALRCNMSELKALASGSATTRGVDVCPDDVVTEDNIDAAARFVAGFSEQAGVLTAVTGAIDLLSDGVSVYAIRNGSALQGRITGAGCMLSCICVAFLVANPDTPFEALTAAVSLMGVAGEVAEARMGAIDGNASFRTYLIDALYALTGTDIAAALRIEKVL